MNELSVEALAVFETGSALERSGGAAFVWAKIACHPEKKKTVVTQNTDFRANF
ncbi:MAG: hypothetical protein ACLQSR_17130 [Limisphaerales bacterium]